LIRKKINELKGGLYNIELTCRILNISRPKIVSTRKGETVLREVIIGDETGRTKLTIWGENGGILKEGSVIKIIGAWTSVYKNQVNLNAGNKTKFEEVNDPSFPAKDKIPNQSPIEFEDLEPKEEDYRKKKKKTYQPKKKDDYEERGIELD